jgi:uncharacterized membrane protein
MALMALDHVRDYFTSAPPGFDPTGLNLVIPAYFVTRWVTHFCAPTFVLLAGTGAFLSGARGKSTGRLAWFLLTRGLWLVLLELTVVYWSWTFKWDLHVRGGAVIWAIGWSMVCLAGLVYLPTSAVVVFGLAVIAFHNLFDNVQPDELGHYGWLWAVLHQPGRLAYWFDNWPSDWHLHWAVIRSPEMDQEMPGMRFDIAYPLLPWIGTMAAGYGLGALLLLERKQRRRQLLGLGVGLMLVFIALRASNRYGDQQKWLEQGDSLDAAFSFLNCTKYPPSLLFLLMTLGPAIAALGLFDCNLPRFARPLIVFGRVPLFFYLIHIPLIHGLAVALDYCRFGWSPLESKAFFQLQPNDLPTGYGLDLPRVYAVWLGVLVVLYPLCYGFMRLKRRYPGGVLSYL